MKDQEKSEVVSASPAPKGEAMFFCGDCNAPYKLDGQVWPQMWYPTCLHKNPMFRPPSFPAAQPVGEGQPPDAEGTTEQLLMAHEEMSYLFTFLREHNLFDEYFNGLPPKGGSGGPTPEGDSGAERKTQGSPSGNLEQSSAAHPVAANSKVEEIARKIANSIVGPLIHAANGEKKISLNFLDEVAIEVSDILGPFFTQVSQPPTEMLRNALRRLITDKEPNGYPLWFNRAVRACKSCDSEDLCRTHHEMAERDFAACEDLIQLFENTFLAAPVTPVSQPSRNADSLNGQEK